jgi:hypothetical protein
MPAMLLLLLRRVFDLVCAIAGLALLVLLGPGMLPAAARRVPEAHELIRVSGITTGCRHDFGGVSLFLQGYQGEFRLQLESCVQGQVDLSRDANVTLNAISAELRAARKNAPIRAFGFEAEGRLLQTADSDLRSARLDRAVVTTTGLSGSVILLWLGWTVGTHRGALRRLLIGESSRAAL